MKASLKGATPGAHRYREDHGERQAVAVIDVARGGMATGPQSDLDRRQGKHGQGPADGPVPSTQRLRLIGVSSEFCNSLVQRYTVTHRVDTLPGNWQYIVTG